MPDCKTAEKMIPGFLADELDSKRLKWFLQHVSSCSECREELSIQFLVSEGLNTLETDNSYDLQKAYDERIAMAWNRVRLHRRLFWIRNIFLILVAMAIIGTGLYLYFVFLK